MNLTTIKNGTGYLVGINETSSGFIGEFEPEVDGFYVFYPADNKGFFSEELLLALADKLKELNEPWKKQLDVYFAIGGTIHKENTPPIIVASEETECPDCHNTGWDGDGYTLICHKCGRSKND